jgi:hypothetical protein
MLVILVNRAISGQEKNNKKKWRAEEEWHKGTLTPPSLKM